MTPQPVYRLNMYNNPLTEPSLTAQCYSALLMINEHGIPMMNIITTSYVTIQIPMERISGIEVNQMTINIFLVIEGDKNVPKDA